MSTQPDKITLWKELEELGVAGAVADAIVRTQPVPDRLLRALGAARTLPILEPSPARLDYSYRVKTRPTSRELEVAAMAAAGLSDTATAERLGLSLNTVKNHRRRLLAKLGARTMTQAVSMLATLRPFMPASAATHAEVDRDQREQDPRDE